MEPVTYPLHEVSHLFPAMGKEEFVSLKQDIEQHGQREAIWLFHGAVIDGVHRQRACQELGRPVQVREWDGDPKGLVPFVVSLNLKRRHLDESQRAMVAGKLSTLRRGANQHVEISTPSQAEAAALLNVSRHSVIAARKVQENGSPKLAQVVNEGKVSVSAAAAVSELPKRQQEKIVAAGPTAIVKHAKAVREVKAQRVETRRIVHDEKPKRPPADKDEQETKALLLASRWSPMIERLRMELRSYPAQAVKDLSNIVTDEDREIILSDLRELRAQLDTWIQTLESPNA